MVLDLQSLFGLHVYSWGPATPPLPPAFLGSHTRGAIGQPR